MHLVDIINRKNPIIPWEDGEKIPWNDPAFSRRMLKNHLSQDHDWASRRTSIIESHIEWITHHLKTDKAKILDLGCGPGFYTYMLAERGHCCTGIDFSPASINYAREQAFQKKLEINYQQVDIRQYQPEHDFDCVLLTFGEINVFTKHDAEKILRLCHTALKKGGFLVLESHTFSAVKESGLSAATWYSCDSGLFSDRPHLCLQEQTWDEQTAVASTRYFILDAESGQVNTYGSSMQAYTEEEYHTLLMDAGFDESIRLSQNEWQPGAAFSGKLEVKIHKK